MLDRLKKHIDTVVGRYKGRIRGWDVVNEAINDRGDRTDGEPAEHELVRARSGRIS